jgi:hypothetical protein
MEKQINEQFLKMQKIAGVITESQYADKISEVDADNNTTESKKTKMTKTELKEAIRQEILAALTEDNLTEAEDEETKDTEEVTLDAETEETSADDSETSDTETGDTTSSQDVQKELTDALEAAKNLGDKKLVRQIGNALTYFTRQQISTDEV